MADGQVVFEIKGDNKDLKSTLKDTTRAIKSESETWDTDVGEATSGIESSFTGMLTRLGGAFVAAQLGKKLLSFASDAVQVASDLQEVQNVVDVTFGDSAETINKWAKTAGDKFGLTELQAKKYASTMGAMMKSSGMTGEGISDMSMRLAELAADMASFYNLDFETAFMKIRSGMSGEVEPLKQLGIAMTETNLEAYAMSKGFETAYKDMDQAERTMVRYGYLMETTADAQGDFERTQDSYANSVRRLENAMTELKAMLGEQLLPFITDAVNALNDFFSLFTKPKKSMEETFGDITDNANSAAEGVTETAESARDFAQVLSSLGDPAEFMGALAEQTDALNTKQAQWLTTCQELVKTMPELSGIINTQTGEVQGGVAAVNDYINAWEKQQKQQIAMQAVEEKRAQLAEKYKEITTAETYAGIYEMMYKNAQAEYEAMGGDEALEALFNKSYWDFSDEDEAMMEKLVAAAEKADDYKTAMEEQQKVVDSAGDEYQKAQAERQEFIDTATEGAGALDKSEEAQSGAEATVQGMADGLNNKASVLASAVDNINGIYGSIGGVGSGVHVDGSHATGLDFVPFDNYLARLHEGESILNAEEARIWRQFKYGQQSTANTFDYDALGSTMRDNVKTGGNVYLDGQTVGRVISASQANDYRRLERSGWQS